LKCRIGIAAYPAVKISTTSYYKNKKKGTHPIKVIRKFILLSSIVDQYIYFHDHFYLPKGHAFIIQSLCT